MKYEFIDDYLYIDGEKIEIKFEFLSYKRSAFCLSGEYEGGIKTKQVQNKDNFCTNLVCDYDYEQYKVYFFKNIYLFFIDYYILIVRNGVSRITRKAHHWM